MSETSIKINQPPFRVIPYYTGDETLEETLKRPKSVSLLWLEIIFNDKIPWENYFNQPEVKAAYEKACVWSAHFKTMIEGHTGRKPLEIKTGKGMTTGVRPLRPEIDDRDYRRFIEVLNFVSG